MKKKEGKANFYRLHWAAASVEIKMPIFFNSVLYQEPFQRKTVSATIQNQEWTNMEGRKARSLSGEREALGLPLLDWPC